MYSVKTLADSINPHGYRLWTAEITYPRFIHDELMTHRMLSRNTSSSRAVPVAKVIQQVIHNPVIPLSFGQNTRGMQSSEDIADQAEARKLWLEGRDNAIYTAIHLEQLKVHKQFVNRLLMPYTWITTIVSATEWENFFALRTDSAAQPEMRKIAQMMVIEYYINSKPVERDWGQWHVPLMTVEELSTLDNVTARTVSVARCAAVSYLRQHDERTIEEWSSVAKKLMDGGHWSPFEHVALASENNILGNFIGWEQYRHQFISDTREFNAEDLDRVMIEVADWELPNE
jgi:thymidylate synthase ThyX